jgi:hypothetical protein
MNARNHPTVRRGAPYLRGKSGYLALILVALGIALLVKEQPPLSILGAMGCFAGAGFSLWVGEWMVKDLRHEYRYENDEPPQ